MAVQPETRLHILLVEDSESDAALIEEYIEEALKGRGEVRVVQRLRDAADALASDGPFHLVVVDMGLPDSQGIQTVRRTVEAAPDLPVIVLTGASAPELAVEAIGAGAQDYVCKDNLDADTLERAIWYALERNRLRTALLERERELSRNRRLIDQIMASMPGGIVHVNGAREVVFASPAGWEFLGRLGGFHGKRLESIGSLRLADWTESTGETGVGEVEVETPQPRVYEVRARRMEQRDGHVLLISDVTEQRQIDQKIQEQDRLATVGQLAAGIAHDFNNMLTVMMGSAQMMSMRSDLHDGMRKDLDTIVEQGRCAAHLVSQVLDFSRQGTSDLQAYDVTPFLKELGKFLSRMVPENIELDIDVTNEPCTVVSNLTKLQQVITNLAINARDAMPDGGRLTFSARKVAVAPGETPPLPDMEAGAWLRCSMADTGSGIPLEIQGRIFEPFFTTKAPGQGTGLGLAQSYGILRQFGGCIEVDSAPGKGAEFRFYLPITDAEGSAEDSGEEEEAIARGNGETVLLVEDEAPVRRITRAMLTHIGYDVLEAANGEEALRMIREQSDRISLLLTDVVMPRMSGPDLIMAARKVRPGLPVVAMSGYALNCHAAMEKRRVAAHVAKPVTLQALASAVQGALRGERPGGAETAAEATDG